MTDFFLIPDTITLCARCGNTAWREHYPCSRCGGLESRVYVPEVKPRDDLQEAVHEFCLLARETSLMLNEAMKALEDVRRRVAVDESA